MTELFRYETLYRYHAGLIVSKAVPIISLEELNSLTCGKQHGPSDSHPVTGALGEAR